MALSKILLYLGFLFLLASIVVATIHHINIENPSTDLTNKDLIRLSLIQTEVMILSIILFILYLIFK